MRKLIQLGILAFLAASAAASDSAVLRNGFSILYQRRQIVGANTRLFLNQDPANFVDIPTAEIDHFENLPDAPIVKASRAADTAPPFDLNETVKAASGIYRLDPDLVTSVIRAESGFNVRAVSPKGAQGLMQLMPRTASHLGVENAFDPQANVEGGTKYLRELLERYNFDLIKALAAYNAGPQRVEQYNGVPPYQETRAYVARIVRDFNKKKMAAKAGSEVSTTSHSSPHTEKISPIKPAKAQPPTSSTQSPGQN
jgi:soluble lytic murein transglycosylase-like protein